MDLSRGTRLPAVVGDAVRCAPLEVSVRVADGEMVGVTPATVN